MASRSGFKTSSTSAPSKVCPACAKAAVIVPLVPTGLPTLSTPSPVCARELLASISFFAIPASVSDEL